MTDEVVQWEEPAKTLSPAEAAKLARDFLRAARCSTSRPSEDVLSFEDADAAATCGHFLIIGFARHSPAFADAVSRFAASLPGLGTDWEPVWGNGAANLVRDRGIDVSEARVAWTRQ